MDSQVIQHPRSKEELRRFELERVLSDLKEASDIEGALLIGEENNVIVSDLPKSKNYEVEIPQILVLVRSNFEKSFGNYPKELFVQHIFDYNGSKILFKRLKNLTLLIMMQKQGYIGPAMLDIENSIRRIHEILDESISNTPRTFERTINPDINDVSPNV